jgi:hypothetical protein
MKRAAKRKFLEFFDKHIGYLPTRQGVYFVKGIFGNNVGEIEVYRHPKKGLCCYCDDFGSSGTEGVDDNTGCHVSVQFTGLEFIAWKRNLN